MSQSKVRFIVMLGVVCVSFSAIFIRFSEAPALVIAALRMLFTVMLLAPVFIHERIKYPSPMPKKALLLSAIGGVFLALHFATWISSIDYTTIASSTVLVNLQSMFVYLGGALFLKEKLRLKSFLSIGLAFGGGVLISLGDSSSGSNLLYGDLLALLGAVFIAGYMLIGRFARRHLSLNSYTFTVYLSACVTLMGLTLVGGYPLIGYSAKEYLLFLLLAVVCTLLGHSVFNWALKYLKPSAISINILGEPVYASLIAIFLFAEIPTWYQIVGAVIILTGIYLFIRVDTPHDTQG